MQEENAKRKQCVFRTSISISTVFFYGLEVSESRTGTFPLLEPLLQLNQPMWLLGLQDAFSSKHHETLRKTKPARFTGPEGYIVHLDTQRSLVENLLYYFCNFSVNLKLFKISLEKKCLAKNVKRSYLEDLVPGEKLLPGSEPAVLSLRLHMVEGHGALQVLSQGNQSHSEGLPLHCIILTPPNTIRFQHMNLEGHKHSVYSKMMQWYLKVYLDQCQCILQTLGKPLKKDF